MKKPPIEVLLLDFGNVCATFDFHRFINPFSAHVGIHPKEVKAVLLNERSHGYGEHFGALECGTISPARFFHELTRALSCTECIDYETFAMMWTGVFIDENHALHALLHRVPQEKFLLSNTNQIVHSRYIGESTIIRTHMSSWEKRILSYDVHGIKPHPLIYQKALERVACPPDQCIFVDDMPENIAAWEALGGHGIVYNARHDPITFLEDAFKKFEMII